MAWMKEGKAIMKRGSLRRKLSKRVLTTCESITVLEIMPKLLVRGILDLMSRFLEDVRIAKKIEAPQMAQQSIKAPNGQYLIVVCSLSLQVRDNHAVLMQMKQNRNFTTLVKALVK